MQCQFSVCMYGTCGRIDNKADFDFLTLTLSPCYPQQLSAKRRASHSGAVGGRKAPLFYFLIFPQTIICKNTRRRKRRDALRAAVSKQKICSNHLQVKTWIRISGKNRNL